MTKLRVLLATLAVLFVLALTPSTTQAWWGCNNMMLGNVHAFGRSGSLYGLGHLPVPPYYAVHPPVYYGQRYYRTYGESPFARPARSGRSFNVSVQLVTNPFVEQAAEELSVPEGTPAQKPEVDQMAVKPQMIVNPYYEVKDEVVQK
jgi:hypothetical protein